MIKANFNIEKSFWKQFRQIALEKEKSASEILIDLIKEFISKNNKNNKAEKKV